MPKKSRRSRAKRRAAIGKAVQREHLPQPAQLSKETRPAQAMFLKPQSLASRYQYVIPEVKRIGIIAGAIVLVLIILSFVLR